MMDALDHTDPSFRGPREPTMPPPAGPPAGPGDDSGLTASKGFVGLLVALVGGVAAVLLVTIAFAAAGVQDIQDNHAFEFVAAFVSDFVLFAAAWFITAETGGPTAWKLGFRRFAPSAFGWAGLAFVVYLVLASIYTVLFNPPKDNLTDQLGANESTLLAVITGVFVIGIAPVIEETFFRGFLFQSLRSSWGVWLAAPASGAIFSAVHAAPDKFVQLAILGTALAFVFHKTRSIWPCISLHALNNTLAFIALVADKH
jgi:uncharacterized protein